jgi:transmembrane sensor
MSSLDRPLSRSLREPLDQARIDRLWHRIRERRQRSPRHYALLAAAMSCAVLMALVWWRSSTSLPRADAAHHAQPVALEPLRLSTGGALSSVEVARSDAARTLALSDGTHITLSSGSRLVPLASTGERFEIMVERGRARFEVQPQGGRRFTVQAGELSVEVVGTVFSVERGSDLVAVTVERGRVRVTGLATGPRLLGPGESLSHTLMNRATDVTASAAVATTQLPSAHAMGVPAAAPSTTRASSSLDARWRAAVQAGDDPGAYSLLGDEGFARAVHAGDSAPILLELADVARGAGRPSKAALALRELLARFPHDERAALAALTLGRIELDALSQPNRAQSSLRRALELGLPSALQEDALARLVQACARAGDRATAQATAAQYRARFPRGRWSASVQQWIATR